jgi:hypothetical protein
MCVLHVEAKKNAALYLTFPMISAGVFTTGKSPVDTAFYKDGAGAWTSLAIADAAAEIGSMGVYEIDLTAAEMNHDQIFIKLTETAVDDLLIVLNMVPTPVVLADGVEHGGSEAYITLNRLLVESTDANGIDIGGGSQGGVKVFGGDFPALVIQSNSSAQAVKIVASSGKGIFIDSDNEAVHLDANSSDALSIYSNSASAIILQSDLYGIHIEAEAAGIKINSQTSHGINIDSDGHGINIDSNQDALHLYSNNAIAIYAEGGGGHAVSLLTSSDEYNGINIVTPGHGINIEAGGGGPGRHGIFATGGTDGDGFRAVGQGTGVGFASDPDADGFGSGGGGGSDPEDVAAAVWAHATALSVIDVLTDIFDDTNELQLDWEDGGRLDVILDAVIGGEGGGQVTGFTTGALKQFFTINTGESRSSATGGSVVAESSIYSV